MRRSKHASQKPGTQGDDAKRTSWLLWIGILLVIAIIYAALNDGGQDNEDSVAQAPSTTIAPTPTPTVEMIKQFHPPLRDVRDLWVRLDGLEGQPLLSQDRC